MSIHLPTGTVTFLFTDIEGSTQLWEKHPEAMGAALARHDLLLQAAVDANHGHVIKSTGDGLYAVFASAGDGINTVVASQRALQAEDWPTTGPLRVRMALHTGEAELRQGDYFGPALNRTARLMAVGSGGQCLISQATAEVIHDQLPTQIRLRDLGDHRLKDLVRPEHVYQVLISGLPDEFPPLKSLNAQLHNLPVQLTTFVGREEELAETRRLLGATRLLTLTGPGGTGKTRLALQLAAEVLSEFSDGVNVVFLAALREPELVISAIAQVLGVQEAGGQPLQASVKEHLRDRQTLLLFDNFEQILAAAPFIGELLTACPRLKILVTSRETLHLYGEQEYATPPLALPDPKQFTHLGADSVSNLAQSPAVALFVQRAAAAKPGFALTSNNATTVAEICIRLDGLPLALELAAAKLKLFPPQMLLARLQQRLALLTGGAQDLPARQRTLRDEIAWSYDLLTTDEQKFFRRLSVFLGGFTLEAAHAIGAADGDIGLDSLDALTGLIDKSLVRQLEEASGEARFGMLETIRDYGLEQLQACGEQAEVQQQHADYFAKFVVESKKHTTGPEQVVWDDRLEAELGNLRAVLAWSKADAARTELGLHLADDLFFLWSRRGPIGEGRAWLAELLTLPESACYPAARATALTSAGILATRQGDYAAAHALLEESIALCRNLAAPNLAFAMWGLGDLEKHEGHYERATPLLEESLELSRAIGRQLDAILALTSLGDIALLQSDFARATAQYEESLTLHRELGNMFGIARVLNALGRVAKRQQKYAQAQALHEESLALFRQLGSNPMIARILNELGNVAQVQGEVDRAKALYTESLVLSSQLGIKRDMSRSLVGLAGVAGQESHYEQAARLSSTAEKLFNSFGAQLEPTLRADYEQTVAVTRLQLGEEEFSTAWAKGRAMTLDQAIEYALTAA